MRILPSRQASLAWGLLVLLLPAIARGDEPAFEKPPQRSATQILGAEGVKGPGWTVREPVTTAGYLQQFDVESQFGLYRPASRRMLKVRLHEIETMSRLFKMGGGNAYVDALGKRLVALPKSLVKIVENPLGTVKRVPQAVTKTFGRVTSFFGSAGKGGTKVSPDELRKSLVASKKRELAAELKVDVYSSNSKLQTLLDEIATARYAGEFTVSLASYAIPGGAGSAAYNAASYSNLVVDMLADKTEGELLAHNQATLAGQGMHRYLVRKFLESSRLSPRNQSVITTAIASMQGVAGRGALLEASLEARDETRAFLQEQQAVALARYHRVKEPLTRLHAIGGIVLARTKSNAFVALAAIDLASYDAGARHILKVLAAAPLARSAKKRTLHIQGRVTQRFVDEAKAAGFRVVSGWPWLPAEPR